MPRGTLAGILQQLTIIREDLGDIVTADRDARQAMAAVLTRLDRLVDHLHALQKAYGRRA